MFIVTLKFLKKLFKRDAIEELNRYTEIEDTVESFLRETLENAAHKFIVVEGIVLSKKDFDRIESSAKSRIGDTYAVEKYKNKITKIVYRTIYGDIEITSKD